MLRKRAKFKLRIVVMARPHPIYSYGWLKANRLMPRKRKTIYSAVTATVS